MLGYRPQRDRHTVLAAAATDINLLSPVGVDLGIWDVLYRSEYCRQVGMVGVQYCSPAST